MRYNELVLGMTFTNGGGDRDEIVLPKYAMTFSAVIEKVDVLCLAGLGFGDEQALQVLDVARRHCAALKDLDLSYNGGIELSLDHWAEFIAEKGRGQLKLAETCTRRPAA